jgi:hypothetical protein
MDHSMVPNYMNGSLYGPKPILLFCWQFEIEESPHELNIVSHQHKNKNTSLPYVHDSQTPSVLQKQIVTIQSWII